MFIIDSRLERTSEAERALQRVEVTAEHEATALQEFVLHEEPAEADVQEARSRERQLVCDLVARFELQLSAVEWLHYGMRRFEAVADCTEEPDAGAETALEAEGAFAAGAQTRENCTVERVHADRASCFSVEPSDAR